VQGYMGKGRGQGIGTLTKPLPSMRVGGYPQLFGRVVTCCHCNYGNWSQGFSPCLSTFLPSVFSFSHPLHYPHHCCSPIHPLHMPHPTLRTSSCSLTSSHQSATGPPNSHALENPNSQHLGGDEVLLAEGGTWQHLGITTSQHNPF